MDKPSGTIKFENGYFMAPNNIFDMDLKLHEKIVYLYLCRCGNNSKAFPSYNTIAKKCSISRRKAIDVVTSLKEMGLIKKRYRLNDYGENMTNVYDVVSPTVSKLTTTPSERDALGSAQHALSGAEYAPNKELGFKELDFKELNKSIYLISQNEAHLFSYYSQRYKEYFGKEHPTMNEEKMKYLEARYENYTFDFHLNDAMWMMLVDYHFDNLSDKNNGNILSFLSDNGGHGCIYRYCEELAGTEEEYSPF